MKVLHVDTERTWRGGQQQAIYLYENLREKGISTHFISTPLSKLSSYLKDNSLPFTEIKYRGEWDLWSGLQLAKFSSANGYQILHLHSGHALSWGLWAKLFAPKLKIVATRRVDFPIKKNLFSSYKYKTKRLDVIVAISENIRKVLLHDGITTTKIRTIPSGIDLSKHTNAIPCPKLLQTAGIKTDALVIGTVAAFADHKDYPNLIRAAAKVVAKHDKACFVAVGEGYLLQQMKAYADSLSLSDRFFFLGYRNDIGNLLKTFDIFVLASKMEGLGTSVLDALAVNLPVVATNAGGIPEMIKHGFNGILVPARNDQALADALLNLLENPALIAKLKSNSRSTSAQFDYREMAKKYLELYAELLAKK